VTALGPVFPDVDVDYSALVRCRPVWRSVNAVNIAIKMDNS
jgi:hypothetical protein